MKYIYFIAAVIAGALALIIIQFFVDKPSTPKNPAIVINERVITVADLAKMKQAHDETRPDFINSLITKELMIQEAQKSGIDREEQFRQSIQNFYEHSLIKTLMDRKIASLNITVSDEEVERYYSLLDKKFDLTVSKAASVEDIKQGKVKDEKINISFGDLSGKMKNVVCSLKKGEKSPPFVSGVEHILITVDDVRPGGEMQPGVTREAIKKLIAEDKRDQMITEWIDGMKKKAKITIYKSAGNGG